MWHGWLNVNQWTNTQYHQHPDVVPHHHHHAVTKDEADRSSVGGRRRAGMRDVDSHHDVTEISAQDRKTNVSECPECCRSTTPCNHPSAPNVFTAVCWCYCILFKSNHAGTRETIWNNLKTSTENQSMVYTMPLDDQFCRVATHVRHDVKHVASDVAGETAPWLLYATWRTSLINWTHSTGTKDNGLHTSLNQFQFNGSGEVDVRNFFSVVTPVQLKVKGHLHS